MKHKDCWVLLDYEHSVKAGQTPRIQLSDWPSETTVSYETSADMYLVGLLISKSGITNLSEAAHDLENKLKCSDNTKRLSAPKALEHSFFDSCKYL